MSKDKPKTEPAEKPAELKEHMGRWAVSLYGTVVYVSPYKAMMECLTADINTAIRRHEIGYVNPNDTRRKKGAK